jgi:hypothetical protein
VIGETETLNLEIRIDAIPTKERLGTYNFGTQDIRVNPNAPTSLVNGEKNIVYTTGIKSAADGDIPVLIKLNYRLGTNEIIELNNINEDTYQPQIVNYDEERLYIINSSGELYLYNKNSKTTELLKTLDSGYLYQNAKAFRGADDNIMISVPDTGRNNKIITLDPNILQFTNVVDTGFPAFVGIIINYLGGVNILSNDNDDVVLKTLI